MTTKTVFRIVPTGTTDTYAAGRDGNNFDSREEAKAAIPSLRQCGPDMDIDWDVIEEQEEITVIVCGRRVLLSATVELMDDDIRESLHGQEWNSAQAFVDAYCDAHRARYGQDLRVN